ncbi:MAG: hypothetical protein AUH85_01475 [Chloroflexi bacterium 13_1_40CM_4_68_4]|nr:MAG: hypothetical protein AUH85_01475 [Chloroflexi bacterium 13_1_40CM_4_68_4]
MEFTMPRVALSAILRPATPGIIKRVVDEAARSSGAHPDDIRAYEALMRDLAPAVLDAIADDDAQRTRTFVALAIHEVDGMRPVPPVARVGLLEIGIRLGREHVVAAVKGRPDAASISAEFETLAEQMRSALVALGGATRGGGSRLS